MTFRSFLPYKYLNTKITLSIISVEFIKKKCVHQKDWQNSPNNFMAPNFYIAELMPANLMHYSPSFFKNFLYYLKFLHICAIHYRMILVSIIIAYIIRMSSSQSIVPYQKAFLLCCSFIFSVL